MIAGDTYRIIAKRPDGRTMFDQTYTWHELKQMQYRVVFSSLEPIE